MPKPYTPNDKFSQKATAEGFRARSVYKLEELDQKFKLIKPNMKILDLGAAPGSWLQYVAQKTDQKSQIVGIDLSAIEPIDNVKTFQADITDEKAVDQIIKKLDIEKFDLIISDLAPKTSGIKDVDQWRSIELSQAVLKIATRWLKPNGKCVLKVFRGADFDEFYKELKNNWKNVKLAHVKASRDRSREIYLICDSICA